MGREVLEAYVRDTIAAHPGAQEIVFGWQGGEPTLAGLVFFQEAVALQEKYRPAAMRIFNMLQTNGTLLDAEWAAFFREHDFLVGLSLDGPARFHDPLRRDLYGKGSHARAARALQLLQRASVAVNTLTVVHRLNYKHGREVYRFLRRLGSRHMQFIPLLERLTPEGRFAAPGEARAEVAAAPRCSRRTATLIAATITPIRRIGWAACWSSRSASSRAASGRAPSDATRPSRFPSNAFAASSSPPASVAVRSTAFPRMTRREGR